jgi:hypothetical protein
MKRTVPIIGIAVAAVAALAVLAAGIGWSPSTRRSGDAGGYYASGSTRLETRRPAFVSDRLDVDTDRRRPAPARRPARHDPVHRTAPPPSPVFVGIARTAAVDEIPARRRPRRGAGLRDRSLVGHGPSANAEPHRCRAPQPELLVGIRLRPGRQALAWPSRTAPGRSSS